MYDMSLFVIEDTKKKNHDDVKRGKRFRWNFAHCILKLKSYTSEIRCDDVRE